MVQKMKAEGFQEFETVMNDIENKKLTEVFVLFSGSKDSSGKSWCPDCVAAEPIVDKALESAIAEAVFVHVSVGDRTLWKDPDCKFRLDSRIKLTCVPTLLKWGTNKRLLDYQCNNLETVLLMFED